MRQYLHVLVSGMLLSGCAGGGAFVSAGTLDYKKLFDGLKCEIVSARDSGADIKKVSGWVATISVVLKGNFARDAALAADLDRYGIGAPNFVTAKASTNRKIEDIGTVKLGTGAISIPEMQCLGDREYNMSNLGLNSWYKKVSERMNGDDAEELLVSLEFKRTVSFVFTNGEVRLDLFEPVKLGPSLKWNNSDVAEITITMQSAPSKEFQTVNLSPETLKAFERIFKQEPVGRGGGGGSSEEQKILDRINREQTDNNLEILQKLEQLQ